MTNRRNFSVRGAFHLNQELAMRPIVEKVMRAFSIKHPVSDDEAKRVDQEAKELAAQLLENYKKQLALRALRVYRP
jgi:hypothetical protein